MNNANFSHSIKKVSSQYAQAKENHPQQKQQEQQQQQQHQQKREKRKTKCFVTYTGKHGKDPEKRKEEKTRMRQEIAHLYIKVNVKRTYT